MGKNQSASNLTNIIKQDANGNISFVSGSTTLMSVSSSGAITTTGNVAGTASYASNAELLDGLDSTVFTLTSSFAAQTASFTAFTASQNILNGTYATTGSNTFNGIQTVNSNLIVTGSITAQTLVVQTITSSVDFVTGSTRFGSIIGNTHVFTGSMSVSGSLSGIGATFSGAYGADAGIKLFGTTYGVYGASRGTSAYSAGMNYISEGVQKWFAGIFENTDNFGFYNTISNNFPMVITTGNNVGIGTTSPTAISGYSGLTLNGTDGSFIDFRFNGSGYGRVFTNSVTALGMESLSTTLPLVFKTQNGSGSTERMTILPNGNVGIGKTNPEGPLHVNGAIGGGYIGMAISNFSSTIGTTSGIDFGSDASTCYNGAGNGQISVTNMDGTTMKSEMNLKIWNGSTVVTGIKISDAGRVSFPTATAQNYGLSNSTAVTIASGATGTVASCTITSVGKPIFVNVTGDINPTSGGSYCLIYIYRNGSPVGKYIIAESTSISFNVPFALTTIDIPGTGTHTYTAVAVVQGASAIQFGETGNGQAPTILAIELI